MNYAGPHQPYHPTRNPGGFSDLPPGRSMMVWGEGSGPITWPRLNGSERWGTYDVHHLEPHLVGEGGRALWLPTNKGVQRRVNEDDVRRLLGHQIESWAHPRYVDWSAGGRQANRDDFHIRHHALRELTPLELFRSGLVPHPPGADAPHDDWISRLTFADWLQDNDYRFLDPGWGELIDPEQWDNYGMAAHERAVARRIQDRLAREERNSPPWPPPWPPPEPAHPDDVDHNQTRLSRGARPMNYADEAGLQEMLRQLASPEHNPTRWGQPHGDQTFRSALADMLRDLGREQEADWVQSGRHLIQTPAGLRPGRFGATDLASMSRALMQHMIEAGVAGEEYDDPFDFHPAAGSSDVWQVRNNVTGDVDALRPQDIPAHVAASFRTGLPMWLEDARAMLDDETAAGLPLIDNLLPFIDAIAAAPFEEEDVDYARPTDYLAHPGRPDTHTHPASGFTHMGGFSQLNDPNGLQTEILGQKGLWDADVLDPTGGNWQETLLELRGMPIDHLYRALLQNGAITRRDVPPPALEDLDLDYAGYARYADEDSELDRLGWDPVAPRAAPQLGPDGFPLRAPARPGNAGTRPAARLTPSVLPRGQPVFIDGFPVYPGDPRYPAQQARPGLPTPYLPYDLYDSETDPEYRQAPPYAPADDPVYPPGVFPPEPGPPAGFGAGYPPPNAYAAVPYLGHWSKPKSFMDARLGMKPSRGNWGTSWFADHPADPSISVHAAPTSRSGRGVEGWASVSTPDGTDNIWESSLQSMSPEALYAEMMAAGLLPTVPAEWEHITSDVNSDSQFAPDDVYPLKNSATGYDCGPTGAPPARPGMFGDHCPPWAVGPLAAFCGPTDYLAHPGRPDRVGHFRSGFKSTPAGWWEMQQGDGPYITADGNHPSGWTSLNADGFNASAFGDIGDYFAGDPPLETSPDFPTPEELYRHMLTEGWFPRVDAPPPALEDLDLDYCSYAQYAELDENLYPIPKKAVRPKIDEFTGFPTAAPISGPPAPAALPPAFFPRAGEDTELDRLGWDRAGVNPNAIWRPQRPPTASARYDSAPQYPPPYGQPPPQMGGFGGVGAPMTAGPSAAPQPTMGAPAPMMPPPAPPPDLDVHGMPIARQYAAQDSDPAVYDAFCAYLDAHPQHADQDEAALYGLFREVYAEAGRPTSYGFGEDRAGFESAIRDNPFEATNHLVAGDFFDDNDLPDEAAFRRAMGDWFGAHDWRDLPSLGLTSGFRGARSTPSVTAMPHAKHGNAWSVHGGYVGDDPALQDPRAVFFPQGVTLPNYWVDSDLGDPRRGQILQANDALAHLNLPVDANHFDWAPRLPSDVAAFRPRGFNSTWSWQNYPDMEQAFRHSFLHGRRNRPVMASQYADDALAMPLGSYIYAGPPEPQETF